MAKMKRISAGGRRSTCPGKGLHQSALCSDLSLRLMFAPLIKGYECFKIS